MKKILLIILAILILPSCVKTENNQDNKNRINYVEDPRQLRILDSLENIRKEHILDSLLEYCDVSEYLDSLNLFYPTDSAEYADWDSATASGIYFVRVDYANRELDTIVDHFRYVCRPYGVDCLKIITREEYFKFKHDANNKL